MSFRDIFMKNKKKRPRTPTTDQSETNHSFVKNMKSKVSGLMPARISLWFSSSGSSVVGNGSTQMNDGTDSSEDELELTPPAKRKCLNSQESQHNQQFDVESTPFQADNLSNSHNILYSSIQSPPGRKPFTRDLKYSSTQEESNVESASFDTTDTNVSNKHMPSTSGQSVAMKRNTIFDVSKIKDSAKKIKTPTAVTDGLLGDGKPRFRPSLYGSPFYPGPTMYGGASASTYINKPIVNHHKVVKVRESNKTASDTLSVSTRRVLDLLEDFPSPLIEARRIPVLQNWDRSVAQENSSPKSGSHPYKKQELTIPSIASILRLKQHSRLMDTTKAVRQIIASHSSTLPNFQHYLADNSESNTSKPPEKERTHKLKTRVTRIDRGIDGLTMPVPVQLPTAVLQIDKDNLPKFSITPTTSTTSLSSLPTKSVFDSNYKPQPMSEIKTPPSIFSNTAASKTPPSWSGNTMFKFANPAASPVHISQDLKIMNKITEMEKQNTNEKVATEEVVQLNTSSKKSETPKNTATLESSKGWNCPDCWVSNKSDADRCVCCSAKRPLSKDKNTQGQDSSTPSIGLCMPATSAFVPFSTSSSMSGPIAVQQEWTCDNCWIKNKNSVKKCAACGGSKPGGIESMPTLAPNPDAKSEKDWTCETCYVKNKSAALKCIACSVSKTVGKEQSDYAPSTGSNLSSFKPPDGKLQEIMRAQKDKWECPGCLIRNEPDKTRCQCCDMEREGPSKEITPKPFTFPKESNINFKFGIDPKEQEKNIAKKVEEVPKPGFKLLEQTEANNNNYVKFSSNDGKFKETKFNDAQSDDKGYSVVPEGPKASFTFGIPKKTQEETLKPATVPSVDKPKTDNQDKTKLTFGIIEPPKTENSTPIKAFPTFLATSTPMTCAKTQSTDAPTVSSLVNKNPLTEIKSTNPTFRFGDTTAGKPKQFSFDGESGRAGAGVNAVSLSSTNGAPTFSFGASLQNQAVSTSASPATSLFPGPQVATAATKPPTVTLFSTTETTSATATAAAPLFTFRNDAPSTTPESKPFSFGSTNNSDIKSTSFGSIASNDIKASPFGTGNQNENKASLFALANNNDNKVSFGSTNPNENKVSPFASAAQSDKGSPFGSVKNIESKASPFGTVTNNENKALGFGAPTNTENKASPFGSAGSNENKASPFGGFTAPSGFSISAAPTLGGTVGSMASSMSGLNESRSGASSAGFRPSTQEAAWPAKSETSFGATGGATARDSTQFTFGGIGNQFGSSGAGTGTSVFGAQPSSATQNVFAIASPPAGGGLFGNTTQPAQPATIFGAQQHTSNVFGAQNQASSTFGVPTPTQTPAFGAHTATQSPAFGSAAQSPPSAFGAPAPSSQTPAFGIPTQNQQTTFGAPVQNQSSTFGVPAQNQSSVFGASASSQPPPFGTPTQPTAAAGAAFNFGSGVFSFGQQTSQQAPQPLGVYSFGSGNTMSGMMSQPMDGGLGPGGVQFTMGSSPAPGNAASMRRVRKAVRRNQPR